MVRDGMGWKVEAAGTWGTAAPSLLLCRVVCGNAIEQRFPTSLGHLGWYITPTSRPPGHIPSLSAVPCASCATLRSLC